MKTLKQTCRLNPIAANVSPRHLNSPETSADSRRWLHRLRIGVLANAANLPPCSTRMAAVARPLLRRLSLLAAAIFSLLTAPALRADDCGTTLNVESRTEWRNSASDVLSSIQLNPLLTPVSYEVKAVTALGDLLQNPGCAKLNWMGISQSSSDPLGHIKINYSSLITSIGSTAGKFGRDGFGWNGIANALRPTIGPCEPPVVRSMVHFGGDVGVLVDHAGLGAYPRRINEASFSLCRSFVVLNNSGVTIEVPVSIAGEVFVWGSTSVDSTYAKATLSLQGSIGGQSVSGKAELYSTVLTPLDDPRSINETRRVLIPSSPEPQTIYATVSGSAHCEAQAKGSGKDRTVMASAGATAMFPNSIDVGIPTGVGGSPIPGGVRIWDGDDGFVYLDTTANPVSYMPVASQTAIWFFDQPFDSFLGPLLPANYTVTAYGDTTVFSPPGMAAGLVRRADADADPLANVTNHNAFRLSYTVADSNTTPAVTVFIYDQPGGTPRALAYDLPLTPGYHEATLRYADGDASGRGVFTPGGPDLTRLHSIGIANTLFTNWPAQSALVTSGQLAVTFHHLAAFTAPPPGYEGFAITNSFLDTNGLFHLLYPASTNDYYLLFWSTNVTAVTNPIVMALGVDGPAEFLLNLTNPVSRLTPHFFRLLEVPLAQPLDVDGDGYDDLTEFRNPAAFNPFVPVVPIVTNVPPPNPGTNAPSNSGQPYYWSLNGHTYMPVLVTNGITWAEADAAARAAGGHLATLSSDAENNFVFGTIDRPEYWAAWPATPPPAATGPWLGGLQPDGAAEPAGGWQWVTPEPFSYTAWQAGAPDNRDSAYGANENRLAYAAAAGGLRTNQWNDAPASLRLPGYVIEFEPTASGGDCIPREGLVAWWKGDGNALDSVGTNHGKLMNGATFNSGISGQAFNFDGTDDYIDVGQLEGIKEAMEFTVAAWIFKVDAANPFSGFVGKWDTTPYTGSNTFCLYNGELSGELRQKYCYPRGGLQRL